MENKKLTTPVLFLVFNRPEKTKQSFDAIRSAKPSKLYIAADAPRDGRPDDVDLNDQVKDIVSKVDWNCEVRKLYHEKNLGCSLAGKTAWDWIFTYEDEMIFIEDDGVPTRSFFFYCQELLEKYRNDERIAYIGGVNYGLKYGESTYFFSKMCSATYSMATWKRVYDLYEYEIESYRSIKYNESFKSNFCCKFSYNLHVNGWEHYLDSIEKGKRLNTYDTQMLYLVHKYDMYSIYPNTNMVSNIGLDFGGANNSLDPNSKFALKYGNRPRFEIDKIIHPEKFEVNVEFEKKMFQQRMLKDKPLIAAKFNFYIRSNIGRLYRKLFS